MTALNELKKKYPLTSEFGEELTNVLAKANAVYAFISKVTSLNELNNERINNEYGKAVSTVLAISTGALATAAGAAAIVALGGGTIGILIGGGITYVGVEGSLQLEEYLDGRLSELEEIDLLDQISRNLGLDEFIEEGTIDFHRFVCSLYPTNKWDLIDGCSSGLPPIVIDLNNDGFSINPSSSSGVQLDTNGDLLNEKLPWPGSTDGVLFIDINANGILDNVSEFNFAAYSQRKLPTDLDGLMTFDNNYDFVIDSSDKIYDNLFIWSDLNGDGISQSAEVQKLSTLGLFLDFREPSRKLNEPFTESILDDKFSVKKLNDTDVVYPAGSFTLIYEETKQE